MKKILSHAERVPAAGCAPPACSGTSDPREIGRDRTPPETVPKGSKRGPADPNGDRENGALTAANGAPPGKQGGAGTGVSRLLIVDSNVILREGLRRLFSGHGALSVCGEAANAQQALHAVDSLRPDLAIADMDLPGAAGVGFLRDLFRRRAGQKILVYTNSDERVYAVDALHAGASGFLMKREPKERLVEAVEKILQGKVWVSEEVCQSILRSMLPDQPSEDVGRVDVLTRRQRQVFELIGKGLKNLEIARALGVQVKTISAYREQIKERLGIEKGTDLVRLAVLWRQSP